VPDSPVKPDATSVFYLYGTVMLAVQTFERTLATLVLILGRSRRTRELNTPEAVARALEKGLKRGVHAYQRASPSALRKELPDDFDVELMREIEGMIGWRDRLAHRYLIEKLLLGGEPMQFQPDTADELMRLGTGFMTLNTKLQAQLSTALADLPAPDAPDALRDLIKSLAQPIMRGEQEAPEQFLPAAEAKRATR
jgi:hypothetical protein